MHACNLPQISRLISHTQLLIPSSSSLVTWQGVLGTSDGVLPPFTTSAQAEGAIEGVYTDYRLKYTSSTNFTYSRFDKRPSLVERLRPKFSLFGKWRAASSSEWEGKKKEL